MTNQKPGRIENPVLEQSERRKKIDVRRKYFQEHKLQITIAAIGIIISTLILLFGILNYCK